MDYIFYQVAAINGFDAVGHYLRAGLIVNPCSTVRDRRVAGCCGELPRTSGIGLRGAASAARAATPVLRRGRRARCRARARRRGRRRRSTRPRRRRDGRAADGQDGGRQAAPPAPRADSRPPTPRRPRQPRRAPRRPTPTPPTRATGALLDYLFGGGPAVRGARRGLDRRQPGADRRRDDARRSRRRLPVLQRQPGPAVRARPTSSTPRSRTRRNLVVGNDVRIGGTRVGAVDAITPKTPRGRHGRSPCSTLKLDKDVEPLPVGLDACSSARARRSASSTSRSPAGTSQRRASQDGDTIPLAPGDARRRSSSTSS